MNSLHRIAIVFALTIAWALVPAVGVADGIDAEQFDADLSALTRHPHRLAGFGWKQDDPQSVPGSIGASRYIEQRLRDIGFAEDNPDARLFVQTFPVIQHKMTECELQIADETIGQADGFYACRPNLFQASVTPEQGLTGELIYVGSGQIAEYPPDASAKDKIVVMEYDCGQDWQIAFSLGARAVIFIGQPYDPDGPPVNAYHHINLPANLPRFFVTEELAERLGLRRYSGEVKIQAACEWGQSRGRNVIALLTGTNPKFAEDRPGQAVVLAAPIDSLSEVPSLSPGARDAANCAALLQMAEYFKDKRPRRDVAICFFDGQTRNHKGARAFYGALMRGWNTVKAKRLEELRKMLEEERTFRQSLLKIINQPDLFSASTKEIPYHQEAIHFLRGLTRRFDGQILDELRPLRLKEADLRRDLEEGREELKDAKEEEPVDAERTARLEQRVEKLERQLDHTRRRIGDANKGGLAKEDMDWNRVEKYLYEGKTAVTIRAEFKEIHSDKAREAKMQHWEDVHRKLLQLKEDAKGECSARLNEIDQELAEIDAGMKLRDALGYGNKDIVLHISMNLGDARKRWTFLHGDDSTDTLDQDKTGNYTGVFAAMEDVHRRLDGISRLRAQNVTDLPALCAQLVRTSQSEPIAQRIWQGLSPRHRELIRSVARDPDSLRPTDRSRILAGLNDVLEDREFFREEDFRNLDLSSQDQALLARPREDLWQEEVERLNRLTFQSVFEDSLASVPATRTCPSFDKRPISGLFERHHFAPSLFVDSGAIARIFSVFNVSAMTVMDRMPRQGHWFDTVQALDTETFLAQLDEVAAFVQSLADADELNVSNSIRPDAKYHDAVWTGTRRKGGSVLRTSGGSAMADRPVPGALVTIMPAGLTGSWKGMLIENTPPGFTYPLAVRAGMDGKFGVPPAPQTRYKSAAFFAVGMDQPKTITDPDTGEEQYIPSRGVIDFVVDTETYSAKSEAAADFTKAAIHLFKCNSKSIIGYGFDRGAIQSIIMRAASTAKFRQDRYLSCEVKNMIALFAPYDAKGYKLFNKAGAVLLNNNESNYKGRGLALDDRWEHPVTAARTARDLLILNDGRLDLLRDNHINQEALEILNSQASDLCEDAEKKTDPEVKLGSISAAASIARRAYPPLVNVLKDLVTAVVLLLLLAIPFAYSLERLLVGTPHIYRQIGWFTLFFILTFGVLYFVNPAFRLAATPIVIFLAFGIILLSALVIFIMTRKLQTEIKRMQGLSATVHSADVSRLSTMLAAIHMGISTMRRRPLRTLLTAVTVVLLTFTILTFASFGTSWGNRVTYEETLTGPARILVRHQLWNPIGEGVFKTLRGYLSERAEVVPRYWISPTATEIKDAQKTGANFERLVSSSSGDYIAPIAAAIGIDKRDVLQQPKVEDLFQGDIDLLDKEGIFLTNAVSEELHLTDKDIGKAKVLYLGFPFTYAGVVTDELAGFTMLEGSSMLPVDYHSSSGGSVESFTQDQATLTTQTMSEMPDIESAQFVTYNLHMNVVIPTRLAKRLNGGIRSITIYPTDTQEIRDMAQQVARISELPTYVGDATGVHRLIFTSLATASGWQDLLIPVTLGGLIVFATMLGSVSDREREIYTFSSLGLAPPHVASLFFAEASVYAVVGGMGGYLLGQFVTRVTGWMAGMGWVTVPTMNYSSTNAIVTILIVMGTVLVSTIYPAVKASRSANPGIQRHWKIPKPEGDLYDLIFPFTVSAYDITGVVSFLKEHFDNHTDTSLGVFASMQSHIFRQKDSDMLGFAASVALAPFDLGVTQNFAMLSQPSEIEGIDEVRIFLYRLSGARGDWQRANRVFINELRKQLLIWRSLTPQVMDRYRQLTLEKWDSLPREQMDGQTIGEMM